MHDHSEELLLIDGHITVRRLLPDGRIELRHKLGTFTGTTLAEAHSKFREALRCQSQKDLQVR